MPGINDLELPDFQDSVDERDSTIYDLSGNYYPDLSDNYYFTPVSVWEPPHPTAPETQYEEVYLNDGRYELRQIPHSPHAALRNEVAEVMRQLRYSNRSVPNPIDFNPRLSYQDCGVCGLRDYSGANIPDGWARNEKLDVLVCRQCKENDYTRCIDCGQITYTKYTAPHSDNPRYAICVGCERRRLVLRHDADPLDRLSFKGGDPYDKLYFGIELEVEPFANNWIGTARRTKASLENFCVFKHDGSLSDGGFEIVSAPATFDYHRNGAWDKFFKEGGNQELRSARTRSCGMHVHISRAGLSQMQIGKMVAFLHNPDNRSFVETIAQRPSNSYCDMTAKKKVTEVRTSDIGRDNRYTALNLNNYYTVELRIFRGTVSEKRFFKNLEFTHALVKFCGGHQFSIGESSSSDIFALWVWGERKTYPNLWEFMVEKGLAGPTSKRNFSTQMKELRARVSKLHSERVLDADGIRRVENRIARSRRRSSRTQSREQSSAWGRLTDTSIYREFIASAISPTNELLAWENRWENPPSEPLEPF